MYSKPGLQLNILVLMQGSKCLNLYSVNIMWSTDKRKRQHIQYMKNSHQIQTIQLVNIITKSELLG